MISLMAEYVKSSKHTTTAYFFPMHVHHVGSHTYGATLRHPTPQHQRPFQL